jgi:hypothetical protein
MNDDGIAHYLRRQLRAALTRGDLADAADLVSIIFGVEAGAVDLESVRVELERMADRGARWVEQRALELRGRPSFDPPDIEAAPVVRWLSAKKERTPGFDKIYTRDAGTLLVLCKAIDLAQQAADWRIRQPDKLASPVLILGETGTGKELLAKAMHDAHLARFRQRGQGEMAARTFGTINCAGLAEDVVESELFGHVKGAFTGATQNRDGLLVANKLGTVLLDEIGDAPLERVQPRLLRFLQDGEVRPVGADRATHVFPWLIAATNHPERLREELQARLGLSRALFLPPLAQRGDDAIGALEALVHQHAASEVAVSLTPAARRAVATFSWPANLREVDQVARDVAAQTDGQAEVIIDLQDLPDDIQTHYSEYTPLAEQCRDLYSYAVATGPASEREALRAAIIDGFRAQIESGRLAEVKVLHLARRLLLSPVSGHFLGLDQAALARALEQRLRRIEQTLIARLEGDLASVDGLPVTEAAPLVLTEEEVSRDLRFLLDLIEGFATSPDAHAFTQEVEEFLERLPTPWQRALDALPAILRTATSPKARSDVGAGSADQPGAIGTAPFVPAVVADVMPVPRPSWDDLRGSRPGLEAELDRLGTAARVAEEYAVDPWSSLCRAAATRQGRGGADASQA